MSELGWKRVDHRLLGTKERWDNWYPTLIDMVLMSKAKGFSEYHPLFCSVLFVFLCLKDADRHRVALFSVSCSWDAGVHVLASCRPPRARLEQRHDRPRSSLKDSTSRPPHHSPLLVFDDLCFGQAPFIFSSSFLGCTVIFRFLQAFRPLLLRLPFPPFRTSSLPSQTVSSSRLCSAFVLRAQMDLFSQSSCSCNPQPDRKPTPCVDQAHVAPASSSAKADLLDRELCAFLHGGVVTCPNGRSGETFNNFCCACPSPFCHL